MKPIRFDIDAELADEMRHFFSDFQHLTRDFFTLKAKLSRLQRIDRKSRPKAFREAVEDILKTRGHLPDSGESHDPLG